MQQVIYILNFSCRPKASDLMNGLGGALTSALDVMTIAGDINLADQPNLNKSPDPSKAQAITQVFNSEYGIIFNSNIQFSFVL